MRCAVRSRPSCCRSIPTTMGCLGRSVQSIRDRCRARRSGLLRRPAGTLGGRGVPRVHPRPAAHSGPGTLDELAFDASSRSSNFRRCAAEHTTLIDRHRDRRDPLRHHHHDQRLHHHADHAFGIERLHGRARRADQRPPPAGVPAAAPAKARWSGWSGWRNSVRNSTTFDEDLVLLQNFGDEPAAGPAGTRRRLQIKPGTRDQDSSPGRRRRGSSRSWNTVADGQALIEVVRRVAPGLMPRTGLVVGQGLAGGRPRTDEDHDRPRRRRPSRIAPARATRPTSSAVASRILFAARAEAQASTFLDAAEAVQELFRRTRIIGTSSRSLASLAPRSSTSTFARCNPRCRDGAGHVLRDNVFSSRRAILRHNFTMRCSSSTIRIDEVVVDFLGVEDLRLPPAGDGVGNQLQLAIHNQYEYYNHPDTTKSRLRRFGDAGPDQRDGVTAGNVPGARLFDESSSCCKRHALDASAGTAGRRSSSWRLAVRCHHRQEGGSAS